MQTKDNILFAQMTLIALQGLKSQSFENIQSLCEINTHGLQLPSMLTSCLLLALETEH